MGYTVRAEQEIAARGPRYAVRGTIRRGEYAVSLLATAEQAEQCREAYRERGYNSVRVYLPDLPEMAAIDLPAYGEEITKARVALSEALSVARAAANRAAETGRAEAEIARSLGVDRGTVRDWLGKPKAAKVS